MKTKIWVDRVKCYCFDKGNDGLVIGATFTPPREVDDTEEAILNLLSEGNFPINPNRVFIAQNFDHKNGREIYEEELLQCLESVHRDGEDPDDMFWPDIEEFSIFLTQEKMDKYGIKAKI